MAVTFEQFFAAIAQQESGGSYSAIGPATSYGHAYGKYQVLEPNIGPWTLQYWGKRLTPNQFLNNPDAQEAVARGKLKSYYDQYGARGAASAWYSGNPNLHQSTSSQSGGPSIKDYVDSVMEIAAGKPTGGTGGGSYASAGLDADEEEVRRVPADELAEEYGFVQALFDSNKELSNLFDKAVSGQWTASKFQAELRDTKWWKTHSSTEREFLVNKYGDPATANQDLKQAYTTVRQLAARLGIRETPANMRRMNSWAYNVVAKGWTEDQLRNEIGKFVTFGNSFATGGEAADVMDQLTSTAYAMGINRKDSWFADAARKVVRGVQTVQDFEDAIRNQAKAQYSYWSEQIDAGQSVMDLASPYINSMATILELPAGDINLFDPKIRKAMEYKTPNGKREEAKPLWMFENELRDDPRWRKTKNAQDSLMQVGHQVLVDFGMAY